MTPALESLSPGYGRLSEAALTARETPCEKGLQSKFSRFFTVYPIAELLSCRRSTTRRGVPGQRAQQQSIPE